MSFDNDIKIFDEYHTVCREVALSLKQANDDLGTKFAINSATNNAWTDYNADYTQLKLQENVIEGEWLTERMPSFKNYMEKHEAVKQPKRKFFISTHSGVTSMERLEKEVSKVVIQDMEDEANELELETIPLEDAFKTPAEEVMEEISKKKAYGDDFEKGMLKYAAEKNINLQNAVVFVPNKAALEGKVINEQLLRSHIFPNKLSVIETLEIWKKTLGNRSMHYDASDLFVVDIDKNRVKVGNIPYIFKEAEKYYGVKDDDKAFIIKLVGKRHLSVLKQ